MKLDTKATDCTTNARQRILQAAQQCFQRAGIRATSVQDIADVAGMARSSFYRQFRDIDDILVTLAVTAGASNLRKLDAKFDDAAGPVEKWGQFIGEMVRMARQRHESDALLAEDSSLHVVSLFYRNEGNALGEITAALSPFIERGKTSGELRTDVETARIAEWLLRQTWALSSIPLPPPSNDEELTRYIATFVLPSLLHPKLLPFSEAIAARQLSAEVQRLTDIVTRLETSLDTPSRRKMQS